MKNVKNDCASLIFLQVFDVSCFNLGGSINSPSPTQICPRHNEAWQLVHSSPDQALWVQALAGDILLCSWARYSTLLSQCLSPPRCINGYCQTLKKCKEKQLISQEFLGHFCWRAIGFALIIGLPLKCNFRKKQQGPFFFQFAYHDLMQISSSKYKICRTHIQFS